MVSSPRYTGLSPSSVKASVAARGSSRKSDTKPEVRLRQALWQMGFRYRKNLGELPGKPDIVFVGPKVAIFVDGDFWHGKNWRERKKRLGRGHNASYWIPKIERNIARDREQDRSLRAAGWRVLRFWESDIHKDLGKVVERVEGELRKFSES